MMADPHLSRPRSSHPGWRRPIALAASGVVHILVLGAFIAWPHGDTAPPPSVAMFDLAPLAAPPEPERAVPPGPLREERIASQSRPDRRRRRDPDPLPAPPPPPPPDDRAVPVPQPERIRTEQAMVEPTAPPAPPAPSATRAASDVERTWEAVLLAHLERHRRYPVAAREDGVEGVVHVRFRVSRTGRILSMEIARSSGSPLLDHAALDTLRRAQPLPAIPPERPDVVDVSLPIEFFLTHG